MTDAHTAIRAPALLITGLFVVALAGRYSPAQVGLDEWVADIRIPGLLAVATGVLLFRASCDQPRSGAPINRRPESPVWMCVFLIALSSSAMWSPDGARTSKVLIDVASLLALIVLTVLVAAPDPDRTARIMLLLAVAAGLVYFAAALAAGPGRQGRYSALGGGPNVFVRVECMALLAVIALAMARRRWWPLLAAPPLAVGAVLSGSRGGLIALAVAGGVLMALLMRRVRIRARGLVLVPAAVLAGWAVWPHLVAAATELTHGRLTLRGLETAGYSHRPELWSAAADLFDARPVLGGGLDVFYAATGYGYPHNLVLSVAADLGLVGLVGLVVIVVAVIRDGRPWRRMPAERVGCAAISVYVFGASMFSGDYYDSRFLWVFAVLAVAAGARSASVSEATHAVAYPIREPHAAPMAPMPGISST